MSAAIHVQHLSKQYAVGLAAPRADTLYDTVGGLLKQPWTRLRALALRRGRTRTSIAAISFARQAPG